MTVPACTPAVIGLVADDLTGAADSAVSFAQHGWRVVLHLHADRLGAVPANEPTPTVIGVTTGSRALADDEAAAVTATAVAALRAVGAERCYLKIDSTVRGSVAGQVAGALRSWSEHPAGAVICPAFPQHRRSVVRGRLLVNDVPLEETAAATDPVTPRTSSDLQTIIPGAQRGTASQIGIVDLLVLDATTDTDLDDIATRLTAASPDIVMVGSGGLAASLARRWTLADQASRQPLATGSTRVLVAVSSLHPTTAGQVAHLRNSVPTGVDILATTTATVTPVAAAAALADRVAVMLADQTYGAVIAVGGDGAAAILHRLSAEQIIVDGAISDGCPTGIIVGGVADGLRLVTKSGGFGDPTTLATLITRLRAGSPELRPPPTAHLTAHIEGAS